MKLLMAVLVFGQVCFGLTYKTYTTPGYAWLFDGIGRDYRGNIFIGNGNKPPSSNAALFQYNFSTDQVVQVMDVKTVSQAAGNWQALDIPGKIHSSVQGGPDGKVYFGSHCAQENANDVISYPTTFRGAHFYRYDPVTAQGEDLSAPNTTLHEGLLDVALGLDHNYMYGVGYPNSHIYRLNLITKVHDTILNLHTGGGSITRILFDDNYGRLYVPWSVGVMMYDPAQDTLIRGRAVFPVAATQFTAMVKSVSGDSIYLMSISNGNDADPLSHILRYIVSQNKFEDLGLTDPSGTSTRWRATLALRWDLNKLYYMLGNSLFSINVITKARVTEATSLPSSDWMGADGVDKNGDLWFGQAGTGTVMKVSLGVSCPVCATKFSRFDPVSIQEDRRNAAIPNRLELSLSPNPVADNAVITAEVGKIAGGSQAKVEIFTLRGEFKASWGWEGAHYKQIAWAGTDQQGNKLPAGIYVARIKAGNLQKSKVFVRMN